MELSIGPMVRGKIKMKSDMKKEDFVNYSMEELVDFFVEVINDMEWKGLGYMKHYEKSDDKTFNIDKYAYAAALLTKVNYVKAKVALKNSTQTID
jgi:hypothetical protein